MSFDISRRVFLRGAGLAAVGVGFHPSSLLVRTANASELAGKTLVKVFLRGGADGLNMVVPFGDPEYYGLRGAIAVPRPGQAGGAISLDGYFGLHSGLAPLKPLWDDGRLAILPAVGNYSLTRSHFDAQDYLETGTPGVKTTADGWLGRVHKGIPGSNVTEAVAFSTQRPRSYLGGEPVLVAQSLAAFDLRARNWRAEAESALQAMYGPAAGDVGRTGRETLDAIRAVLGIPGIGAGPMGGYPSSNIGNGLRQAAQIIRSGLGSRTIYVNVPGAFDTHSGQLAANAVEYTRIGEALAAFANDLGRLLDDVVVMVTTEFGRTAFVNGAAGTDHGSAHCLLLLGGSVRGGRILGGWPGLSRSQLYQQRDLAVSIDFRDVFAEVARRHLGVSDAGGLFPGYTPGPGPGAIA